MKIIRGAMDKKNVALEKLKKKKQDLAKTAVENSTKDKSAEQNIPADQVISASEPPPPTVASLQTNIQAEMTDLVQENIFLDPATRQEQPQAPVQKKSGRSTHLIVAEETEPGDDDDDMVLTSLKKPASPSSKKRKASDSISNSQNKEIIFSGATGKRSTRNSSGRGNYHRDPLKPSLSFGQWFGLQPISEETQHSQPQLPEPAGASSSIPAGTSGPTRQSTGKRSCSNPTVARELNENSVLKTDLKSWNDLDETEFFNSAHCMEASNRGILLSAEKRAYFYKELAGQEEQRKKEAVKGYKDLRAQYKQLEAEKDEIETKALIEISKATEETEKMKSEKELLEDKLESIKTALEQANKDREEIKNMRDQITNLEVSLGAAESKLGSRSELVMKLKEQLTAQRRSKKPLILEFLNSPFFEVSESRDY